MSFLDRLDTRTLQLRRQTTETMIASIVTVNGDGSYNIAIKGNSGVMKRVPYLGNGNLQVGDTVVINMSDGDRQRPQILMYGGQVATFNPLTFDLAITYGNWFSNVINGGQGALTSAIGSNQITSATNQFNKLSGLTLSASASSTSAISGNLLTVATILGKTHVLMGNANTLSSISILSYDNFSLDFMIPPPSDYTFDSIIGNDSTAYYVVLNHNSLPSAVAKIAIGTGSTNNMSGSSNNGTVIWQTDLPTGPELAGFSTICTNIVTNLIGTNIVFQGYYTGGPNIGSEVYNYQAVVGGLIATSSGQMQSYIVEPTFQTAIFNAAIGNNWIMPVIPTRTAESVGFITGSATWVDQGVNSKIVFDFASVTTTSDAVTSSNSVFYLDDTASLDATYELKSNIFPNIGGYLENSDNKNLIFFSSVASDNNTYYSVFEINAGDLERIYGPSVTNPLPTGSGVCGAGFTFTTGSLSSLFPDFVMIGNQAIILDSLFQRWQNNEITVNSIKWITNDFIGVSTAQNPTSLTVLQTGTGDVLQVLPDMPITGTSLMTGQGIILIMNPDTVLDIYQ